MFSDPFSTLMAMLFLCFIGMLIMFLFVIRSLSDVLASLRDLTRQQTIRFTELEQQLMDLSFAKRELNSQSNVSLVNASDAPDIMTDSDLSSLLTSISDSRVKASESLLPFDRVSQTVKKKNESPSLVEIFDAPAQLEQEDNKNNDRL